jgi:hypothetical protein
VYERGRITPGGRFRHPGLLCAGAPVLAHEKTEQFRMFLDGKNVLIVDEVQQGRMIDHTSDCMPPPSGIRDQPIMGYRP